MTVAESVRIPRPEGICSVKASHNLARVSVSFDQDHLVPSGGLAVTGLLAQKLGVAELVDRHVTLTGEGAANGGAKALTVIGSALAGGDCIDDTAVLRAGATLELFDQVRAPSTVGIWLRLFIWAAVRQLDRVTRILLARAWAAGLGPDLVDPDHGERTLPQRSLDVLQEIAVLLHQNQMPVPILPTRRPRRQYPKRLVSERVVHELDPTRVHIQDATLRQSLQRPFERLANSTARPAGHHQLAPEVAPGNLEDLVRPLLNHRSCPHCRQ
jgi:hypothetical protein